MRWSANLFDRRGGEKTWAVAAAVAGKGLAGQEHTGVAGLGVACIDGACVRAVGESVRACDGVGRLIRLGYGAGVYRRACVCRGTQ